MEAETDRVAARGQALTLWSRSSMAVKDALAPKRTRLVGEERPERRDDRSKSGIDELLDYVLDVFVGGGSLFIEQVPLCADDPATQRRLGQLMHAEAFAHALAGFAPGPFTPRTVSNDQARLSPSPSGLTR